MLGSGSAPSRFGKYRLLQRLAVGGMAEIYLAVARGLGGFEKRLALKMIHPQYSQDDMFVRMLINEAKLCVALNHPNIVQVFDLGRSKEIYYIAMEYVEGCDTFHLLKTLAEQGQRLGQTGAAFVAHEVAMGLDYAHAKTDPSGSPLGIIHRDISPQNVLLSINGDVKLVDFGIAKARMRIQETQAGVVKGKHYYMSPEQAAGEELDGRTDIFSLGIVLWEMLAGRMCYLEDNHLVLMDRVLRADVPPITKLRPDVDPHLAAITMTAVRKNPDDRYQSAGEMASELSEYLAENAGQYRADLQEAINRVLTINPVADEETTQDMPAKPISRDDVNPRTGITEDSLLFKLPPEDAWDDDDESQVTASEESLTPSMGIEEEDFDDATVVDPAAVAQALEEVRAQQQAELGMKQNQAPPGRPTVPRPIGAPLSKGASGRVSVPGPIPAPAPIPNIAPRAGSAPRPLPSAPPVPAPALGEPKPAPAPAPAPAPRPAPVRRKLDITEDVGLQTIVDPSVIPDMENDVSIPSRGSPAPPTHGLGSDSALITNEFRTDGWSEDSSSVTVERRGGGRAGAAIDQIMQAPPASTREASESIEAPAGSSAAKTLFAALLVAMAVAGAIVGGFYLMQFLQQSRAASEVKVGAIKVTSEPKHARVVLDGEDVDVVTPTVINRIAASKNHDLEVTLELYEPWKEKFSVDPGKQKEFHVKLKPLRGTLTITTVPEGAEVFVDGESVGVSPVTVDDRAIPEKTEIVAKLKKGSRETKRTVEAKDWGDVSGDSRKLSVELRFEE